MKHGTGRRGSRALQITMMLAPFVALTLWGQSAAELSAKYPAVTSYEVRPGILMTPRFDPSGQVCEMNIEKRHRKTAKVDFDDFLSDKLVAALIDELAPESVRGAKLKGFYVFDDTSIVTGNIVATTRDYENISVVVYKPIFKDRDPRTSEALLVKITWRKRACRQTLESKATVRDSNGTPGRLTP